MIDFCLIYLPKPFLKQPDAQQPLGLMYLAASLKKKKRSVVIKNYSKSTRDYIKKDLPECFIYGITAVSMEIPEANDIAALIKEKYPESIIIIGGPGAYSTDFIDKNVIDSIVLGEGEEIIHTIYRDALQNNVKEMYQAEPVNVDEIPFPARELLDKQGGNIFAYDKNYKKGGSTIILSSRGCPFKCAFCSAPTLTHSNKVRFRNPKLIRKEIKHVIKKHGIHQFRFSDDMFTASKKHVLSVCEAIKDLDIAWRISCRVNPLDFETLEIMRDAGCKELSFGIESFDNEVLTGLKKRATMYHNIKALLLAKKAGLKTRILFMIATPFQTPDTIEINKFVIKQVPFDIIACTQFMPIPGCDVWNNPDKYNIKILDRDLKNYNFYMYNHSGRRPLKPIIKIKDRPLDDFLKESEEFRDYIEKIGRINQG